MLGYLIDEMARRAARLRPRPRVALPAGPVKVNIGSGIEVASGWINVDASVHALFAHAPPAVLRTLYRNTGTVSRIVTEQEYLHRLQGNRFVFWNFDRGLPFDDGSIDFIFSSHLLEHLPRPSAQRLVAEIARVLKPGGIVRIGVPDLAIAMRLYQQGAKEDALEYFFTGEAGYNHQHHYMYDEELLTKLLQANGLVDVRRCEYRQGRVPDLEVLDNRPEQTLFVEATRPNR